MAQPRGKRYTLHQTDACRAKIKTTLLVNRLTAHAMGELDLTQTQVRSIEILLNKTLANLSAQELTGNVTNYVARLPTPAASAEAWSQQIASEKLEDGPGRQEGQLAIPDCTKH